VARLLDFTSSKYLVAEIIFETFSILIVIELAIKYVLVVDLFGFFVSG
jgi:hypothetical protein